MAGLWPLPNGRPRWSAGNASVVLLLESGAFRALLTSYAEAPFERRLLERGLLSRVDVLKLGHQVSTEV
jgi:beta-lactamase superfamily II metal-dependent hydrolase